MEKADDIGSSGVNVESYDLAAILRVVPHRGVERFVDISPVLSDPQARKYVTARMARYFDDQGVNSILGIEARGFPFAASVADAMEIRMGMARKPGKLPGDVIEQAYSLEYGNDVLAIQSDFVRPGDRVGIVDDLLATGGTVEAAARLVQRAGGTVQGIATVVELPALGGRGRLQGAGYQQLLTLVSM